MIRWHNQGRMQRLSATRSVVALSLLAISFPTLTSSFAALPVCPAPQDGSSPTALRDATSSPLQQLSRLTTLSIDSGDLDVIRQWVGESKQGIITDATTNPLLVAQAGLSGHPLYADMMDTAVAQAVAAQEQQQQNDDISSSSSIVDDAMDRLAVQLGVAIAGLVSGRVSTEVDPRLSFDTHASIARAIHIGALYRQAGLDPSERVLIKLAATWEGIQAAYVLEREHDLRCNLTLLFGQVQAEACAQHGVFLISPFPGRVLDWHHQQTKGGRTRVESPADDEGVQAVVKMQEWFVEHGYDTICMPASWRPSRGPGGYDLDEIRALAGVDRMTIPPALLEQLDTSSEPVERQSIRTTKRKPRTPASDKRMTEQEFRYRLCMDGCANDKMAEGLRAFVEQTEQLEEAVKSKVQEALGVAAS